MQKNEKLTDQCYGKSGVMEAKLNAKARARIPAHALFLIFGLIFTRNRLGGCVAGMATGCQRKIENINICIKLSDLKKQLPCCEIY